MQNNFKPSVSCLAGARATGREDGIAPRGGDAELVFFLPPKMDSVKKHGKTLCQNGCFFGKDPLFSKNIQIHCLFWLLICFASDFFIHDIHLTLHILYPLFMDGLKS